MMEFLTIFAKVVTCGVSCSALLMFGWWAVRDYVEVFENDEDEDF